MDKDTDFETMTVALPAYWTTALFNEDYSGLDEGEEEQIEKFLTPLLAEGWYPCDVSGESYFSYRNDATDMGGDVLDYVFMRRVTN
jgi:hypothetical protein